MVIDLTPDNFDETVTGVDLPVMVDFYAPWCGPCRATAPIIDDLSEDYADQLTVGKVDIDQYPELARSHHVMSVPTVIFFKDGEEVDRQTGFVTRKVYEDIIKKYINSPPAP